MSVALHRPDDAKGRPSDLIKKDEDYKKIFNEDHPLSLYYFCATLMMKVEELLKSDGIESTLDQKTRLETKFHIMMYIAVGHTKNLVPVIDQIGKLRVENIDENLMLDSANKVLKIFSDLGATNRIVKGTQVNH